MKIILISFLLLLSVWANAAGITGQENTTIATDSIESLEFIPLDNEEEAEEEADTSPANNISTLVNVSSPVALENESLWTVFLGGILGGLAAFLMPCIFPMLPLTVSYFSKKAVSKRGALGQSALYGISIVLIYVGIGLLVTLLFGSDALNALATNGIFNIVFFLMLVLFAASFLGAFEITLPSSWANKADAKSEKKGLAGIFFMAATLALVSFSCTGPIIGTLLVQTASTGKILAPGVGMLGFSLTLALPFVLFSLFPAWIKALPRSGGWLNTVKVVLGFLELALALKFLSNVDLAYHWQWLTRDIFLALWIIIFGLMGLYLLGKLRLDPETPNQVISVPRLMASLITLAFTLYMIPGLWGAPLKAISPFLPPQATQDFDLYTNVISSNPDASTLDQTQKKYGNIFHAPLNLNAFFDYQEGMAYAKKVNKPVILDFTGHACVNCRKMETTVWPDKEVLKRLKEDFVLIQLYVDDKTELPDNEQYTSSFSGKSIKTIGNKWSDFQASRFKANSQPYYVLLDNQEELLINPQGANYDPLVFAAFLNAGKEHFQKL